MLAFSKSSIQKKLAIRPFIAQAILLPLLLSPFSSYSLEIAPLGLPTVPVNLSDGQLGAKIKLGRKLFFDARLSQDGTISCASCHQPYRAFADGLPLAKGIRQQLGTRNTPSLLNVAFNTSLFWDGRRPNLEAQATDPFVNSREHGFPNAKFLVAVLRNDLEYLQAFQSAFAVGKDGINEKHVAHAIASFERTLLAGDSAFDRYYFKDEKSALSPSAVRGLALFQGGAQCSSCHTIDKDHALFSDNKFHSLSIGLQRLGSDLPRIAKRLLLAKETNAPLSQAVLSDDEIAQMGRFAVTLIPADIARFRTPSLRNVALTAPYMHDGSAATLEDAVELEIYYRSVQTGRPLILTSGEKADIVSFLNALSSPSLGR